MSNFAVETRSHPISSEILPMVQKAMGRHGIRFLANPRIDGDVARIDYGAPSVAANNEFERELSILQVAHTPAQTIGTAQVPWWSPMRWLRGLTFPDSR